MTLTEIIRSQWGGVVFNPYQGTDKKVLFVCSAGILRSATGARLYAHKYNTRAAGTYDIALIKVNHNLLAWADQIVFVNKENYDMVCNDLSGEDLLYEVQEKSVVLNIPDNYEHMHPELIKAFKEQFEDFTN